MSRKKNRPLPESLGLPFGGVESHAHINLEAFEGEVGAVIDRARTAGVSHICNVFLGPGAYEDTAGLFADRPEVFFILGVHPHYTEEITQETYDRMTRAFDADPRLKAVGEIGLDYFYNYSPPEVQQQTFRDQLAFARERDLPVVIHSRDAHADSIAILKDMGFRDRPVLWHCFGSGEDLAREIIGLGWHVSIPGTVTFRRNEELRGAVPTIPLERMVLETDCPFLTPEPYRGKRNEPAYIAFTAACVAELRGEPVEKIWLETGRNALEFFGVEP